MNELFQRGYQEHCIQPLLADQLLKLVQSQDYVESQDYRSDIKAPWITRWDAETESETIACNNAPPVFQSVWRAFAQPNWITRHFGPFTQGTVLVNRYQIGTGMRWHYDVPDASFIQVMIYLGDTFSWSDGGYLKMGVCDVSDAGPKAVTETARILPNHGTVVTLLNVGGNFAHAVEPLKTEKSRYTIVLRYGYLENTMTVKKYHAMREGRNG